MITLALTGFLLQAASPSPQTLSLGQAQAILLAQGPDMQSERLAAEKTRAELSEAEAGYWPSLDASASYQAFTEANHIRVDFPPPVGTVDKTLGDRDREEYGIDLTYPLFLGGQRRQQILSRKASVLASAEELRSRRNQLSLRLAALYYAWQAADAGAAAQADIADAYGDYARRVSDEVKQGAALASRESLAKSRWLDAQAARQEAEDARDSLSRAAALLLGLPPGETVTFAADSPSPDTLPAGSGGDRAELAYLDRASESLEHQQRSVEGQNLPALTGLVGYRLANPGLNLGSDDYMHYGLIGLQLKWNLFDGFRTRAQRAEIQSQLGALRVERDRQAAYWNEAEISAERRLARLDLSLEAARAALGAAGEARREKDAQIKQGAATALDGVDARVQETHAGLRVRQLEAQWKLGQWQKRFAHGETLVFPQGG